MADEFKPGDVVRLKSGGPNMTVKDVGEDYGEPSVWCTWFEQPKNVLKEASFRPETLEHVPPAGGGGGDRGKGSWMA